MKQTRLVCKAKAAPTARYRQPPTILMRLLIASHTAAGHLNGELSHMHDHEANGWQYHISQH